MHFRFMLYVSHQNECFVWHLTFQVKGLGWEGHQTYWCFRFIPPCNLQLPTLIMGGWYKCKSQTGHAILFLTDANKCRCKQMDAKEIETISNWLITLVRRREKRATDGIRVSAFSFMSYVLYVFSPKFLKFLMLYVVFLCVVLLACDA